MDTARRLPVGTSSHGIIREYSLSLALVQRYGERAPSLPERDVDFTLKCRSH